MLALRRIALLILLALACASVSAQQPNAYAVRNLVSDGSVPADNIDPNLIDGWGVAFNPDGFVWVNSALAGKAVLYDGNGVPNSLVVSVPAATGGGQGIPTGIVFSSSADFAVTNGVATGPSRFIFASLTGSISGWAPNVDLTNAIVAVDRSAQGAARVALHEGIRSPLRLDATTCGNERTNRQRFALLLQHRAREAPLVATQQLQRTGCVTGGEGAARALEQRQIVVAIQAVARLSRGARRGTARRRHFASR